MTVSPVAGTRTDGSANNTITFPTGEPATISAVASGVCGGIKANYTLSCN